MSRQTKAKEVDKSRQVRSFIKEEKSPSVASTSSNPVCTRASSAWRRTTSSNAPPTSGNSTASQKQTSTTGTVPSPIRISMQEFLANGGQIMKVSEPLSTQLEISKQTEQPPPKVVEPKPKKDKEIQTDRTTSTIGTNCNASLVLDLPKFSGDPLDWPIFKRTFDYTTANNTYPPIENMLRLFNALQGDALEAVKASFSCWNTETVLELLEMRFGNPSLLLEALVAMIKRLPSLVEEPHRLAEFATDLRSAASSLKTHKLGNPQLDNHDLLSAILRKLPEAMLFDCIRFKSDDESLSKMEKLSDFVFLQAKLHLERGVTLSSEAATTSEARKRSRVEEEQPFVEQANITKRRNVLETEGKKALRNFISIGRGPSISRLFPWLFTRSSLGDACCCCLRHKQQQQQQQQLRASSSCLLFSCSSSGSVECIVRAYMNRIYTCPQHITERDPSARVCLSLYHKE
ncbi:unnamed protein product [Trichogramma brassicae]|uniref:Uncharacterized protein n=1 Tax=Trichogramma brassicae TaxID=86971 RepID=A0A6H5IJE6_9HYME|nr:unnamed protein product [Trichogramma brassicae]